MVTVKNGKIVIDNPVEIDIVSFVGSLLNYIDELFEEETGYALDDLSKDDFNSFMDSLIKELKNSKYDE